jgi:hypothetical protein
MEARRKKASALRLRHSQSLASLRQRLSHARRYPSDLTDEKWELVEPLIAPGKPGGGKRNG